MSTTWQRLAGDTNDFAFKVSFARDPDEGFGASEAWAASWGSFELWVGGRNVCMHTEQGEVLDAVHWYLLPFLRWLVDNWDPLLHEERLPNQIAAADAARSLRESADAIATPFYAEGRSAEGVWSDWWRRHSIQGGRAGGLFPDVLFRRRGDNVEISWDSLRVPGAPSDFAFLSPTGTHLTSPGAVAQPFYEVIAEATAELLRRCPSDAVVALNRDVQELTAPERAQARVPWIAGLGADLQGMRERWDAVRRGLDTAAEEAKAALLQPVAERLYLRGAPTAAVLFGAFSPTVASEDVEAVTALMLSATAGSSSDANALEEVADWAEVAAEVDPHHAPWRQGYQLAEAFSDALRLSDEQPVDIEAVLDRLGVRVEELRLTDTTIRGLAILGPGHGPAMAVNRSFEDNERVEVRRFTLAHELAHLLFDRGFDRRVAVASGPWAPLDVEQRANAFAAYLLMPAALVNGVVARYEGVVASNEGVRAIAEQLGTSVTATAWHLANLGFIDRGRVGALIAAQLSS